MKSRCTHTRTPTTDVDAHANRRAPLGSSRDRARARARDAHRDARGTTAPCSNAKRCDAPIARALFFTSRIDPVSSFTSHDSSTKPSMCVVFSRRPPWTSPWTPTRDVRFIVCSSRVYLMKIPRDVPKTKPYLNPTKVCVESVRGKCARKSVRVLGRASRWRVPGDARQRAFHGDAVFEDVSR